MKFSGYFYKKFQNVEGTCFLRVLGYLLKKKRKLLGKTEMSEPILDFEIAQHLDFQRDPNIKTSQNHSIPEFVKRDIWTFLSVKKVF